MKKIALAVVIAMIPTWVAAQQTSRPPKQSKKSQTQQTATGNSCAQYGVGFARVPGTNTCLKIGGGVGAEAGGSSRR
jgi:hypothetical protein